MMLFDNDMYCPVIDNERLRNIEWQINMDSVVSWVFSVLREMYQSLSQMF
jgi:hypothetical protein